MAIGFVACALLIVYSLLVFKAGLSIGARRQLEPKDPKPICGCGHHYALHNEDGTCGHAVSERVLTERGKPTTKQTGYYGDTHKVVYEHEKYEVVQKACPCRRYTGPEPLPRYLP